MAEKSYKIFGISVTYAQVLLTASLPPLHF